MTTTAARPTLAGRYLLVDRIGAGGMGSVWRAWDLKDRLFVAAKLLGPHDQLTLLRFVREQSVRIHHPYVVAPRGWAADDQTVVIAMDLVRGGSVQTLLADHGPLPVDFAAVLLDQALEALSAIHAAGIVHRDVKPANLLLEPTGNGRPHLRLGDFGVAAMLDEPRLTIAPGPVGTGGYMPPEQERGAEPDPRQDLHALGRVGIQLLTGLPPRLQIDVPAGPLAPLLDVLVDPDPDRRPSSAAEARQLLWAAVPVGTPWCPAAPPPYVPCRIPDVPPPQPTAAERPKRDPDPLLVLMILGLMGSLAASGSALWLALAR